MPETHCNHDVLQKLLTESLSPREETEASQHVAACPECRREFEDLAARNDWWSEASQRLSVVAARRNEERESGTSSREDDDVHFSTDFAVDFLEPCDDPHALGQLGDYEIVEVIGRGGMGIVLKGFQHELHRHVAVKVLSPHLATSGAARRRFAREAQATAAVVHPHVMAIHSVNATAKLPYLVMPFVDCQSLQQRLDQQGPLDVKDILRIGMQAALGLAAAHAQGLVHRDVKPANILLETNVDRVLLTDFGLARAVDDATLTRTGIIAGTPQYMSPEQANGDAVDHRSDLFSLGSVLYAMCTARPPFRAETTFGVLRRIRETAPRSMREINPDIPVWLERIVMRLLEKDTANRFNTAEEIATLLEQCLAHVQQPTSVALPVGSGEWELVPRNANNDASIKQQRHRLVAVGGLLGVAALLVITTGWMFWGFQSRMTLETNHDERHVPVGTEMQTELPVPSERTPDWSATDNELDFTEELVEALETIVNDVGQARHLKNSADDETVPERSRE